MTKDNHELGKFELKGIPPAPRGVPQIAVTFRVSADGILEVLAEDKATGKSESIAITAEKGRLSEEEIQRMVDEAERYAEEDQQIKDRINAKNGPESYVFLLKNSLEESLAESITAKDKQEVAGAIEEVLDWMDSNPDGSEEDFEEQRKHLESIANPVLRKAYDQTSINGDFGNDEL